jgi:hypothetical protein
MTAPFWLVREALIQLSLEPQAQRRVLAGSVVTDELALDLDHALLSLPHESQRTGITLDDTLLAALRDLNNQLDAPPDDPLWDDEALDTHPTWHAARGTARQLLSQLPPTRSSNGPENTSQLPPG